MGVTSMDLNDFLKKKMKSRCPWCGGTQWSLLVERDGSGESVSIQRPVRFIQGSEKYRLIEKEQKGDTPRIHMRCNSCGCMLDFDLGFITRKIAEEKRRP